MSLKTVWGIFPYFYKLDPNAFDSTKIGSQSLFWVTVANEDIPLLKHEELHIKQFYFMLFMIAAAIVAGQFYIPSIEVSTLGLGFENLNVGFVVAGLILLSAFTSFVNFRQEAAAYAVSVKYGRSLTSAVTALSQHKYAKGDTELAKKAITGSHFLGLF